MLCFCLVVVHHHITSKQRNETKQQHPNERDEAQRQQPNETKRRLVSTRANNRQKKKQSIKYKNNHHNNLSQKKTRYQLISWETHFYSVPIRGLLPPWDLLHMIYSRIHHKPLCSSQSSLLPNMLLPPGYSLPNRILHGLHCGRLASS